MHTLTPSDMIMSTALASTAIHPLSLLPPHPPPALASTASNTHCTHCTHYTHYTPALASTASNQAFGELRHDYSAVLFPLGFGCTLIGQVRKSAEKVCRESVLDAIIHYTHTRIHYTLCTTPHTPHPYTTPIHPYHTQVVLSAIIRRTKRRSHVVLAILVTIGISTLLMMYVAAHFTPLYSRLLVNAHVCVCACDWNHPLPLPFPSLQVPKRAVDNESACEHV
jgi:hypothetical protein